MGARARKAAPEEASGVVDKAGFVSGESPAPGPVKRGQSRQGPAGDLAEEDTELTGFARVWSLVKLASGLVLVIGISLGVAWGARHYAMTTSRFAIESIDVQGGRRLSSEQLAELAGVRKGQNIFSVNIVEAQQKLIEHPWVRSAHIARQLPRALRVEVAEHEARAVVSIDSELFLVTRSGEPFKPLEPADPYDIPIITGISKANLARDRVRELERVQLGLEVLGHYERLPLSHAFAVQEIHLAEDGSVTLSVGRQGVSLKLGKGPWLMKLRMAERVMGKVQRQGKVPGIIFLDNDAHPERVVVRMH